MCHELITCATNTRSTNSCTSATNSCTSAAILSQAQEEAAKKAAEEAAAAKKKVCVCVFRTYIEKKVKKTTDSS